MSRASATAVVLLPERARFAGQAMPEALGRALSRADRDERALPALQRVFDVLPRGWPAAAVTRQRDAGDAAGALWLRADPAYVRPDISGARLLGFGDALGLNEAQVALLLTPLRPLFGDCGFIIDAPHPSRWYVRLPAGAKLPAFASPTDALGADLLEHLPGSVAQDPGARRWRSLLSEAQIVLHNHPLNAERAARGLAPVNSLWFWGAGALPDRVTCTADLVLTRDEAVQAFAMQARTEAREPPEAWPADSAGHTVVDLRHLRAAHELHASWLAPMLAEVESGRRSCIALEFEDGVSYTLARSQRWRFWRRPLVAFPAASGSAA